MNCFSAIRHRSTMRPRTASALVALVAITLIAATPAAGYGPPDVEPAAQVGAESPETAPSTLAPADQPGDEQDDVGKLQAARIRYGRLAQNLPGQFIDFEARAKEIDRLLRQFLPKVTDTQPAVLAPTDPSTSASGGPPTANAPSEASTAQLPASATAPSDAVGGNGPAGTKTRVPRPRTVLVRVAELNDLARRLQEEANRVRRLSERTFDGTTVPLDPGTEARLRTLDSLLLKKGAVVNDTARHPSPDSDASGNP